MSTLSALKFSLRLLRRDWRAGELRVLFIAITLAVASVTSVGFFTDRIAQTLRQQANELLAADLVLSADQPLRELFFDEAKNLQLHTVPVTQFRSMALSGERNQLVELKAVAPGYPARGQLRLRAAQGAEVIAQGIPDAGTVWVEDDVLRRMQLQPGDSITLGAATFTIAHVIAYEPDRGGNMFSIAPRVMLRLEDLAATQLIQEGSRIQYQLLVAGAAKDVAAYRAALQTQLQRGERIVDVTDARQEVREALTRAQKFLGLAALVSVMLAGVAIAMSARRYVERHLDHCAVMRCVGASQGFISSAYIGESIALGLLASAAGCLLGYIAHGALVELLGRLVVENLPAPSWTPVAAGLLTGLVSLLVFALPPLLHLRNVPTLRVLRRDLGALPAPSVSAYALGFVAICGLLIWQAGELKLALYLIGGLLATMLVLAGMAIALVSSLRLLRHRAGVAWRFGLLNVVRRARSSIVQVLVFGVGIMVLLLLGVVKGDLLAAWQGRLPADAPNRFIINIQPDQVEPLRAALRAKNIATPEIYPMVRARLAAINGKDVVPTALPNDHARRLAEREFNLSWAEKMPEGDNTLVAGAWWNAGQRGAALLSVEEGIAKTLGIGLGDELTYNVAGEKFSAKVASLRKVQWDSFRVNFFVVAPPGLLDSYPASYITSFYVPDTQQAAVNDVLRQFPNFTLIDIAAIMNKVRDIIARVTQAVQYVFVFTLLAGLMVLYAAIQATQDERQRENAVLRTLGAGRRQLVIGVWSEFAALGALSGLVAGIAATVLGWVLARQVLDVPYTLNPWLWLIGVGGGALGVGLAGYLGTRSILQRPPLQVLRGTES